MDIVTQALLGASVAQSGARRTQLGLATLVGLFAGVLADADVLIRSASDPLLTLEYHRHFTHALIFVPLGALVAFALLWPFLRHRLPARSLYLYCFLGYALSGVLDACTSYGTHLLWPLSDGRIAWGIVSVVDPVFSGLLILGLGLGLVKQSTSHARVALALVTSYLLLSAWQLQRAEAVVYRQAELRKHQIEDLRVKPTFGNILLWRSVYRANDRFYIDAVRVGGSTRLYPGSSVARIDVQTSFPELSANSTQYQDILRFSQLSEGFVTAHPSRPNTLGDVRYAMTPLGLEPLWGIELNPNDTEQHVRFGAYRNLSESAKEQFVAMLLGKPIANGGAVNDSR